MSAPDRLQELLQQRALLLQHLAWLDREIAAASGTPVAPAPAPVAPPAPSAPPRSPVSLPGPGYVASQGAAVLARTAPAPAAPAGEIVPGADEILEQYRVAPQSLQSDVKKGCLLYFFGAFALLALAILAFYYLNHRG
jgi:anti-sigma factor RsiW